MTDEEFAKFLGNLAEAEAALHNAHLLMDGSIGFTAGGENALRAAFSAIAVVRDIEVSWHKEHPESDDVPEGISQLRPAELPRRTLRAATEQLDPFGSARMAHPD